MASARAKPRLSVVHAQDDYFYLWSCSFALWLVGHVDCSLSVQPTLQSKIIHRLLFLSLSLLQTQTQTVTVTHRGTLTLTHALIHTQPGVMPPSTGLVFSPEEERAFDALLERSPRGHHRTWTEFVKRDIIKAAHDLPPRHTAALPKLPEPPGRFGYFFLACIRLFCFAAVLGGIVMFIIYAIALKSMLFDWQNSPRSFSILGGTVFCLIMFIVSITVRSRMRRHFTNGMAVCLKWEMDRLSGALNRVLQEEHEALGEDTITRIPVAVSPSAPRESMYLSNPVLHPPAPPAISPRHSALSAPTNEHHNRHNHHQYQYRHKYPPNKLSSDEPPPYSLTPN
ncbi:hypothetical protein GQ42DRAFT_36201 [Ramicandelaber brevisporus]|nr:hypothetical protein GQ42DRAFT_36201 [Ramicandelaber brevisporus]